MELCDVKELKVFVWFVCSSCKHQTKVNPSAIRGAFTCYNCGASYNVSYELEKLNSATTSLEKIGAKGYVALTVEVERRM